MPNISISNFEKHFSTAIIKRGKQYFDDGHVIHLEQNGDAWQAEIEGSATYLIDITLQNNQQVEEYFCDCPFEGPACKHVIAALFAIRDELATNAAKGKSNRSKDTFEQLLEAISLEEYRDFIRQQAKRNKDFKTMFELFFSAKDSSVDIEEKYRKLVQKIIASHSDGGFIDYHSSFPLSRELTALLENGDAYLTKGNLRDALALSRGMLRPVMELLTYADDSSGSLGTIAHLTMELIGKIAAAPQASALLKQDLYNFLEKELPDKIYFDYGDFGYDLFEIFQQQAVALGNEKGFTRFIDTVMSELTGEYDTYKLEFLVKQKILFFQQTGKLKQAEELISQHMEIEDIRMIQVELKMSQNDPASAKKLITEGIRIAQAKDHPGIVDNWEKQLLRIAKLEKDIQTIRRYTKKFAFNHGFSAEYYREWRSTFTKSEWTKEIEDHIASTIKQHTKKSTNKNSLWRSAHPTLLDSLGPLYIEEKYWDRLLPLVRQQKDLRTILQYHPVLVKHYPQQLLEMYLPALEEYSIAANGRSDYQFLVRVMKDVIKDIPEGKEKILALAAALKQRFLKKPRRPALVEELERLV